MSLNKIFLKEQRMDFDVFMNRIREYMNRKGIDINGELNVDEMKTAYSEGKYPSEFVKSYVAKQK